MYTLLVLARVWVYIRFAEHEACLSLSNFVLVGDDDIVVVYVRWRLVMVRTNTKEHTSISKGKAHIPFLVGMGYSPYPSMRAFPP